MAIKVTALEPCWATPPLSLPLLAGEVHLWYANLELPQAHLQQLAVCLSADEQQRAQRFRIEQHKQHFVAGRGLLRQILSQYLQLDPAQLQFAYSKHGKPSLAGLEGDRTLHFNLSHSHGLALYAVSSDSLVGVDLEGIRPVEVQPIAQRFFPPREYQAIAALSPDQQQTAFFNHWTLKEAYLKAIGRGLAELEQIEVISTHGQPATISLSQAASHSHSDWAFYQLVPAANFAGAVAIADNPQPQFCCYDAGKLL